MLHMQSMIVEKYAAWKHMSQQMNFSELTAQTNVEGQDSISVEWLMVYKLNAKD